MHALRQVLVRRTDDDSLDTRIPLRRSPGVPAAVVLTLALGIGATTAMFIVVYGVLVRPLPYRDAERLVVIRGERSVEGTERPGRAFFPLAHLGDLRASTRAFETVAFYATKSAVLSHGGFLRARGFGVRIRFVLRDRRWPASERTRAQRR